MPPSPSPRKSGDRRGRSATRAGSVQTEPPSRQPSPSRASPGSKAGSSQRRASPKSGGSSSQRASKQRASPSSASKQQVLQLQPHPLHPEFLCFGNSKTNGTVLWSLLYTNLTWGYIRLKYKYSVISVIDKRLPDNTKKSTIARSWPMRLLVVRTGFRTSILSPVAGLFQITRFIPAAVPVLKGRANDKWY